MGSGARSPDERDQAEARAQAVFGMAGQLPAKDFFFVLKGYMYRACDADEGAAGCGHATSEAA